MSKRLAEAMAIVAALRRAAADLRQAVAAGRSSDPEGALDLAKRMEDFAATADVTTPETNEKVAEPSALSPRIKS